MRHHMKIKGFFRSLRKYKACWWSLQDHSAIQKSTCQPSKQQTTGRKKTASQKKNVKWNDKFKDDYIKCMKELTSKGYAKESLAIAESGCCWAYRIMQSFPYENHCKCHKKLAWRSWPMLLEFFLTYTPPMLENKKFWSLFS